jgi:hypothetical protein
MGEICHAVELSLKLFQRVFFAFALGGVVAVAEVLLYMIWHSRTSAIPPEKRRSRKPARRKPSIGDAKENSKRIEQSSSATVKIDADGLRQRKPAAVT